MHVSDSTTASTLPSPTQPSSTPDAAGDHPLSPVDAGHLRAAIDLAHRARARGDRPFGARLVDAAGTVLVDAENTQHTTGDVTAHAELNLLRALNPELVRDRLAGATLYASGEPCAMCAGAIFWSGIGRVIFGLASPELYRMAGDPPDRLGLRCGEVLASGGRPVRVVGPSLSEEARAPFVGFFASGAATTR
jgi:tRNA(Arg) A34 adenosine deaminase TadA